MYGYHRSCYSSYTNAKTLAKFALDENAALDRRCTRERASIGKLILKFIQVVPVIYFTLHSKDHESLYLYL